MALTLRAKIWNDRLEKTKQKSCLSQESNPGLRQCQTPGLHVKKMHPVCVYFSPQRFLCLNVGNSPGQHVQTRVKIISPCVWSVWPVVGSGSYPGLSDRRCRFLLSAWCSAPPPGPSGASRATARCRLSRYRSVQGTRVRYVWQIIDWSSSADIRQDLLWWFLYLLLIHLFNYF